MNLKKETTLKKKHEEIINRECSCSICGSKLEFTHFIDYGFKKVKESAVCNECGVKYQARDFSLN
jgi:C4-type Zn-finger protein